MKKLGDAKRIKHARQHLRDCPKRVQYAYCSACYDSREVLKEFNLEMPKPADGYEGWVW